jgi:hypothetical protein
MTITIEEKFIKDARLILDELQAELIASKDGIIRYLFIKDDKAPNEREQRRIIRWLINAGALQSIGEIHEDLPSIFVTLNPFVKTATIGFRLGIDKTLFAEVRKICESDLSKKSAKELLDQVETLGRAKRLETQKLTQPEKVVIAPLIDEPSRTIILAGKKSTIPVGNQWVLCRELFNKPASDWVKENDIVDKFTRGDNKQSFYDANRALSKRLEKDLGVADLIEYDIATARVNPKTIEKLNHSEK